MSLSTEKFIILLTVFSVVFGSTLYVQTRIWNRVLKKTEIPVKKIGKLIDWLIVIAITGLLAYLLR